MFWPCETRTSTCRSFATISSGLYRFLAIAVLLDVKDIPQVGPLQWGCITLTGPLRSPSETYHQLIAPLLPPNRSLYPLRATRAAHPENRRHPLALAPRRPTCLFTVETKGIDRAHYTG